MAKNVRINNVTYSNVPAVELPLSTGSGNATFTDVTDTTAVAGDVAEGKYFYTANGVRTEGTSSGGGGGMNVQAYFGQATVTSTSYTATAVSLTVAVTGTYKVSWTGWRNTNSGTSGSQLYRTRNGTATAIGSATTTFQNTYGHRVELTNQSFQAGDILTVRARARSTSYVMGVANLIIEQTA